MFGIDDGILEDIELGLIMEPPWASGGYPGDFGGAGGMGSMMLPGMGGRGEFGA